MVKRVTRVYHVRSLPEGTRKRGWGYLHDQIWFYDEPSRAALLAISAMGIYYEDAARSPVEVAGKWWRWDPERGAWLRLYMDRKMLWLPRFLGRLRVRIHRFYSGDDDGAFHDHPWWFITFPLSDYEETVQLDSVLDMREGDRIVSRRQPGADTVNVVRTVRRFRLHLRSAEYRHIVHEPSRPFTTVVIAGAASQRVWGFWTHEGKFVPFYEWTSYD